MTGLSVIPKCGGQFFSGASMKKSSFTKPATTIDEQFMILRARGMSFDDGLDKSCIKTILRNNNYFRLEGYWFEYYESQLYPEHRFRCQTSFRSIWNDYRGDSLLRHAIFELIEIFELSFRSVMANVLARNHGPFPYGIDDFDCSCDAHAEVLGRIHGAVHHSKDIFIKKFYEHYSNPLPPIWMIVEIMSLGELSRIYGICLKAFDKKEIASHYGVPAPVLESWIRSIVHVRNRCAHHNRLLGVHIPGGFRIPHRFDGGIYGSLFATSERNGLYNVMVALCYLCDRIGESDRKRRFLTQLMLMADMFHIDCQRLGFPEHVTIQNLTALIKSNEFKRRA